DPLPLLERVRDLGVCLEGVDHEPGVAQTECDAEAQRRGKRVEGVPDNGHATLRPGLRLDVGVPVVAGTLNLGQLLEDFRVDAWEQMGPIVRVDRDTGCPAVRLPRTHVDVGHAGADRKDAYAVGRPPPLLEYRPSDAPVEVDEQTRCAVRSLNLLASQPHRLPDNRVEPVGPDDEISAAWSLPLHEEGAIRGCASDAR